MAFGIGLIGAGGNQRLRHIPGFRAVDDVEIVNVVNRSRASGEAVAAEYGIPRVSESVEELLADAAVDAVCIGTWPYKHLEYTSAALAAGKHVLCEARMANDAAEAAQMLAAARAHPELVAQLVPAPFDFRLGYTAFCRLQIVPNRHPKRKYSALSEAFCIYQQNKFPETNDGVAVSSSYSRCMN